MTGGWERSGPLALAECAGRPLSIGLFLRFTLLVALAIWLCDRRTGRERRRPPSGGVSVAVRLVRREGPFLEGCAPPVLRERQHPQVSPAAGVRAEVVDRNAHHGGGSFDRHDITGEDERLVGAVPFGLPEPGSASRAPDNRGAHGDGRYETSGENRSPS